jgi:phospholipid/cholesterol/gamma-HCH transport system substrate-binding protein
MTHGVKVRLIAFVVLSAVGIVYVAGSYLGLVDRVLGRGVHIHATLPTSGGLFTGSEVTYRGLKVGKIDAMHVTHDGLVLDLNLKQGTQIPRDSPMYVHNLSAVGEQYLDFEPKSKAGPFAKNGDTIAGSAASLPESEEDLLVTLNDFVQSVDKKSLTTVVSELGKTFHNTAVPLRTMVDSGSTFVEAARESQQQTIQLFDTGETVLKTQQGNSENIRSFARDLADLTGTLKTRDADLRTILQGGGATAREVDDLLKGLEPTLPVFIGNLVTVNQVVAVRLSALEQLLVTFPRMISSGFTGTPGDGYGHINVQTDNSVPPCTKGYKPPNQWRPGTDLSDSAIFPAKCLSGPPINMRGNKYAPQFGSNGSNGRSYRVSPYDPKTGVVDDGTVGKVRVGQTSGQRHTVFGDDTWQWLLLGPEVGPESTR